MKNIGRLTAFHEAASSLNRKYPCPYGFFFSFAAI